MNTTFAHFVLVDFENVPDVDLTPAAGKPVHVTLLIGKNQKLKIGLVNQIVEGRIPTELIVLGSSGHNALDITLAFYLGRAVERAPTARFWVVSKDDDYDAMLNHLVERGFAAKRIKSLAELRFFAPAEKATPPAVEAVKKDTPAATTAVPKKKVPAVPVKKVAPVSRSVAKPSEDRQDKIRAFLRNPESKNRPGTLDALVRMIKNRLPKEATDADAESLTLRFEREKIFERDGTKVVYLPRK